MTFEFTAMFGSDVAFERGCTEVLDESLYKCQTAEDNHGDTESSIEFNRMNNNVLTIKMIFQPMIGNNVLHYCNCHGTGCNKDWASAGEQATSAQPGDTTTRNF